ncbi:GlxA family transcriptional regulator [Olivibacter ginsenosidimutans]|uniref:GlxA family transcriptional regulator n=1 Tax=Olivibacter ginsenosidimutans TaxID=1176537 RepID=A0ABP9BBX7_9SPHI
MDKTKHIVLVVPPMTSILDVAGPLEVFTKTTDYLNDHIASLKPAYTTHVLSVDSSPIVHTSAGLPIVCEGDINSINYEVDTLLFAGKGTAESNTLQPALTWLKEHACKIRRIGSICAGAFILAEAGLLNGRRATTHWQVCAKMATLYPQIKVEKDPIYVKDGNIYTSAGISTGMDLSLALVEEDFGRDIAVMVARLLVLYLKRPGNQSQFSNILMHQQVDYEPIQTVQEWIIHHLDEELTVELLAEKVSMSPRNFARVFLRETGITPAKYVEKVRLETARRRLEETRLTIDEISNECGVGSADGLRRLFLRHLKTTPSDYRRSFATAAV